MTRRAMTPARKRRIWLREEGICYHCGEVTEMFGPEVRYDHRIELWITKRDEDADVYPTHTTCDAPKTAAGQTIISKIKRLIKKGSKETRKPSTMRSPGFQTKLTRGFNGKVRPRG